MEGEQGGDKASSRTGWMKPRKPGQRAAPSAGPAAAAPQIHTGEHTPSVAASSGSVGAPPSAPQHAQQATSGSYVQPHPGAPGMYGSSSTFFSGANPAGMGVTGQYNTAATGAASGSTYHATIGSSIPPAQAHFNQPYYAQHQFTTPGSYPQAAGSAPGALGGGNASDPGHSMATGPGGSGPVVEILASKKRIFDLGMEFKWALGSHNMEWLEANLGLHQREIQQRLEEGRLWEGFQLNIIQDGSAPGTDSSAGQAALGGFLAAGSYGTQTGAYPGSSFPPPGASGFTGASGYPGYTAQPAGYPTPGHVPPAASYHGGAPYPSGQQPPQFPAGPTAAAYNHAAIHAAAHQAPSGVQLQHSHSATSAGHPASGTAGNASPLAGGASNSLSAENAAVRMLCDEMPEDLRDLPSRNVTSLQFLPDQALPALQQGEKRMLGCTLHPVLAQWYEAKEVGYHAKLEKDEDAQIEHEDHPRNQITVNTLYKDRLQELAGSARAARQVNESVAKMIGIQGFSALPEVLDLKSECVLMVADDNKHGRGLVAAKDLKKGDVLGPLGGYLLPAGVAEGSLAARQMSAEHWGHVSGRVAKPEGYACMLSADWELDTSRFTLPLKFQATSTAGNEDLSLAVWGLGYGNRGLLINDALDRVNQYLKKLTKNQNLTPEDRKIHRLTENNVEVIFFDVRHMPFPFLVAAQDVAEGQALHMQYGQEYWSKVSGAIIECRNQYVDESREDDLVKREEADTKLAGNAQLQGGAAAVGQLPAQPGAAEALAQPEAARDCTAFTGQFAAGVIKTSDVVALAAERVHRHALQKQGTPETVVDGGVAPGNAATALPSLDPPASTAGCAVPPVNAVSALTMVENIAERRKRLGELRSRIAASNTLAAALPPLTTVAAAAAAADPHTTPATAGAAPEASTTTTTTPGSARVVVDAGAGNAAVAAPGGGDAAATVSTTASGDLKRDREPPATMPTAEEGVVDMEPASKRQDLGNMKTIVSNGEALRVASDPVTATADGTIACAAAATAAATIDAADKITTGAVIPASTPSQVDASHQERNDQRPDVQEEDRDRDRRRDRDRGRGKDRDRDRSRSRDRRRSPRGDDRKGAGRNRDHQEQDRDREKDKKRDRDREREKEQERDRDRDRDRQREKDRERNKDKDDQGDNNHEGDGHADKTHATDARHKVLTHSGEKNMASSLNTSEGLKNPQQLQQQHQHQQQQQETQQEGAKSGLSAQQQSNHEEGRPQPVPPGTVPAANLPPDLLERAKAAYRIKLMTERKDPDKDLTGDELFFENLKDVDWQRMAQQKPWYEEHLQAVRELNSAVTWKQG